VQREEVRREKGVAGNPQKPTQMQMRTENRCSPLEEEGDGDVEIPERPPAPALPPVLSVFERLPKKLRARHKLTVSSP